jgi:7-cyano-7-deazaguanine synthase
MDSVTLLYHLRSQGYEVHALSFDYGQRHKKELDYARGICAELGVPHYVVDLSSVNVLLKGSSLTDDIDVPEGHYAEPTMKQTVVPNRNMIMLSIAVGHAVSIEAEAVFFGAHAGDHAIYPDCRKEFVEVLSAVCQIANYHPVRIEAPFIDMDKGDIAIRGKELGVPYNRTWTCYKGLERHCGKCGACAERIEAMAKAGVVEPENFYA